MDRPPAVLEVLLAADGSYTFTAWADVAAVSPGRLVFDPGFRYPGLPRPGLPAAVAAIPGRELVQELYLNDAGDVDLAMLERRCGHCPSTGPPR